MKAAIMRKLVLLVEGKQKTAAITISTTQHPPCFESKVQYENWLEAVDPEMGSPPPARRDWPKEPNYCRDCNNDQRLRMCGELKCLFPDTKFIIVGTGDDREVVGVSSVFSNMIWK